MVNSRCFILMKNRVRPNSQLFNSWGCNSCKLTTLNDTKMKQNICVVYYFNCAKSQISVDFTSSDFSHFPYFSLSTMEFPDFSRLSRWVVTLLLTICYSGMLVTERHGASWWGVQGSWTCSAKFSTPTFFYNFTSSAVWGLSPCSSTWIRLPRANSKIFYSAHSLLNPIGTTDSNSSQIFRGPSQWHNYPAEAGISISLWLQFL